MQFNLVSPYVKAPVGLFSSKARDIIEAMFIQADSDECKKFGIRPDKCKTFDYNGQRPYWKILSLNGARPVPYMMLSPLASEVRCVVRDCSGEVALCFDSLYYKPGLCEAGEFTVKHAKTILKNRLAKFVEEMRNFAAQNASADEATEDATIIAYTRYGKASFTLEELDCLATIVKSSAGIKTATKKFGESIANAILGTKHNYIEAEKNIQIERLVMPILKSSEDAARWTGLNDEESSEEKARKLLAQKFAAEFPEVLGSSEDCLRFAREEAAFIATLMHYSPR